MAQQRSLTHRLLVNGFMAVAGVVFVLVVTACLPKPPPDCDGPGAPPPEFALVAQGGGPDPCDPPPPCIDCGGASGDPHITTFDQRHYDFHTAAEVVAARTPDGSFEVQWRQEQVRNTQTGGVTAVAMLVDGSRISIVGAEGDVRVDGRPITLGGLGETVLLESGVTIHHVEGTVIVLSAERDAAVHMIRYPGASGVLVDPPDDHAGEMEGLLGDADGDPDNDLVLADGTVLDEAGWEAVHPELGEAWRVVDDTTLFDYEGGRGPDDYWDPSFPDEQPNLGRFTDEERAEAEAICREAGVTEPQRLEWCIIDVLLTGDPSFAERAFAQQAARDGSGGSTPPLSSGDGGGEAPDRSGEAADSETIWTAVIDGADLPMAPVALDDRLIVQLELESGDGALVGLDRETGEEEWQVDGVDPHCQIIEVDGHIVAMAGNDGPLSGPDGSAAIVAVDGDGSVRDERFAPDDLDIPLASCGWSLVQSGDTVLYVVAQRAIALDADDLSERWRAELPGRSTLIPMAGPDDDVWLGWMDGGELVVGLLDVETGDVDDEVAMGGAPGALIAGSGVVDPDGGFIIGVRAPDQELIVRLDQDLEVDWSTPLATDEIAPPNLAVAGDMVVGYTASDRIVAFDLSDGERLWSTNPTGSTNNSGQILGDDQGNTYLGSYRGAHLESYDPEGRLRWQLDRDSILVGDDNPGDIKHVGPLVDGVVFGTSDGLPGVVIVAMAADGG